MDASKVKYARAFVSRFVRKDPNLAPHKDDLVQEALIGIMVAGQRFDPTRGAKLSTVEWTWMFAKVTRFINFYILPHRGERSVKYRGDDEVDALTDCPDEGTLADAKVQLSHDWEWFVKTELPERVRKNFRNPAARERVQAMALARVQGATLQEVGDQFGVTRERVRQITAKLNLPEV